MDTKTSEPTNVKDLAENRLEEYEPDTRWDIRKGYKRGFIDGFNEASGRTEAHGEVSPLNALVSDNRRWKDVDEGTPNINVGCSEEIFIVPKGHKKAKPVICINTGDEYEFHDARGVVYDLEQVETYIETPETPE